MGSLLNPTLMSQQRWNIQFGQWCRRLIASTKENYQSVLVVSNSQPLYASSTSWRVAEDGSFDFLRGRSSNCLEREDLRYVFFR